MPGSKILVIDDSESILSLLKSMLEKKGYEVQTAMDGEEGLKLAREINPNLIILDLMLPKIDGYTICRFLKFDDKYKGIPIIMLTARASQEDLTTGKETGADAYIMKPFDQDVLFLTIDNLLKKP